MTIAKKRNNSKEPIEVALRVLQSNISNSEKYYNEWFKERFPDFSDDIVKDSTDSDKLSSSVLKQS